MSTFASQSADILVIIKTIKNLNHSDAVPQLIKNHKHFEIFLRFFGTKSDGGDFFYFI